MNCQSIDALLDSHATATLSAAARSQVDDHLAACSRCADAWSAHEALRLQMPVRPRDGLFDEMLAGSRAAAAPAASRVGSNRISWRVGIAAGLAAVLVLAGLAEFVGQSPLSGDMAGVADDPTGAGNPGVPVARPAAGAAATTVTPDLAALSDGIDYRSLAAPAPTSAADGFIEVCSFFMFGCRHCFDFESEFSAWTDTLPGTVAVLRVPVIFNDTARLHARAFYTAEALGQVDALIEPFYAEIHERGNPLATLDALRDFFVREGIAADRFEQAFGSQDVDARLQQAIALNRGYRIDATPSIGINGRYVTSPGMSGSTGRMLEIADALIEAERDACDGDNASRCPIGNARAPSGRPDSDQALFR